MLKKFFSFVAVLATISLVFSLPLAVSAQEAGLQPPPPPANTGSFMPQQPSGDQNIMGPQPNQNPTPFSSGPTCNVNGVEKPGTCGDRQQMFGPGMGPQSGGEGQMGQPGQFNGSQMGPSDEERGQMDAKRQEVDKQMRAKGLENMKRGVKQFAKALNSVQARIDKLEKQNVTVPTEMKEKIAQAKTAVEAILAAQDPEEAQDQMQAMQETGDMMQNIMPKLEMLARLPQMLKKADKEVVRLEKAYKTMSAKATRAKVDVSNVLQKWQATIDEMRAELVKAKAGEFSEDEDPMQTIGENVFNRLEEAWRYNQTIDMVLNIKRNLKQVASVLKRYERIMPKLEKKGEDMTEAKSLLAEMKAKYDEVNNLATSGVDSDEMEAVLENMGTYMEMQEELEDLLHLGGPSAFDQEMKAPVQGGNMPQINTLRLEKIMLETKNLKNDIAQTWQKTEQKMLSQSQIEKVKRLKELAKQLKDVKSQIVELTADGVSLPDDLKEGVLSALTALFVPSSVAQR